jgi:hypothetical protein
MGCWDAFQTRMERAPPGPTMTPCAHPLLALIFHVLAVQPILIRLQVPSPRSHALAAVAAWSLVRLVAATVCCTTAVAHPAIVAVTAASAVLPTLPWASTRLRLPPGAPCCRRVARPRAAATVPSVRPARLQPFPASSPPSIYVVATGDVGLSGISMASAGELQLRP